MVDKMRDLIEVLNREQEKQNQFLQDVHCLIHKEQIRAKVFQEKWTEEAYHILNELDTYKGNMRCCDNCRHHGIYRDIASSNNPLQIACNRVKPTTIWMTPTGGCAHWEGGE